MKKFKIAAAFVLTSVICLALSACGASTISGDPAAYTNSDKSFSIDLPTSDEEDWVINEDTTGDVLDISNKDNNINIQIQCLSKTQAAYVSQTLEDFETYAMENTLSDLISDMDISETDVKVPDFITNSKAYKFTMKKGTDAKGILLFMESDSSYYTCMITAVDEAYDRNKSELTDAVLSIKEIKKVK